MSSDTHEPNEREKKKWIVLIPEDTDRWPGPSCHCEDDSIREAALEERDRWLFFLQLFLITQPRLSLWLAADGGGGPGSLHPG